MPNPIAHFDLQADDVERARRFYEQVFLWRFEPFGPPDFYLIFTGAPEDGAEAGIHGSVSRREQPLAGGGRNGFECTIAVDDLDATRASVESHGGKIVMDAYEIVGVGRMIKFEDTEGNVVCAMQYEPGR